MATMLGIPVSTTHDHPLACAIVGVKPAAAPSPPFAGASRAASSGPGSSPCLRRRRSARSRSSPSARSASRCKLATPSHVWAPEARMRSADSRSIVLFLIFLVGCGGAGAAEASLERAPAGCTPTTRAWSTRPAASATKMVERDEAIANPVPAEEERPDAPPAPGQNVGRPPCPYPTRPIQSLRRRSA